MSAKTLPQPNQIPLSNLREWINKETEPTIEPLRTKGTKLLQDIQGRLNDTIESSQKIVENSEREMQKNNPKTYRFARNANKFANSLSETLQTINVPETINYQSLHVLSDDLEKKLTVVLQQRGEAYRYITPYFIFDRRKLDVMLKRLIDINKELSSFLTTKYSKAKIVEDTALTVDKLFQTINQADETQKQLQIAQHKEKSIQQQLLKTQQEIASVQNKAELSELMKTEERIKELREGVKHNLRYLQKPFFKLQSLAQSGKIAIPVDESKKINEYLSDPFEALATEIDGHPTLKSILRKLNEAINQGKLKLKSTRLRKAQEQIESILNKASLDTLHKSCIEAHSQRNQLLKSEVIATLKNQLVKLQEKLRLLQKESELTSSRVKTLEDEHRKLLEKIQNEQKELEEIVSQLTGKNIQVVLP